MTTIRTISLKMMIIREIWQINFGDGLHANSDVDDDSDISADEDDDLDDWDDDDGSVDDDSYDDDDNDVESGG